jgi:hypothetical protein
MQCMHEREPAPPASKLNPTRDGTFNGRNFQKHEKARPVRAPGWVASETAGEHQKSRSEQNEPWKPSSLVATWLGPDP